MGPIVRTARRQIECEAKACIFHEILPSPSCEMPGYAVELLHTMLRIALRNPFARMEVPNSVVLEGGKQWRSRGAP